MRAEERLAAEAARLLSEPLLADAFEQVRMDALLGLAEVDAADTNEILRLQAAANCLNDVVDLLKAKIIASGRNDGGMLVETEPTA